MAAVVARRAILLMLSRAFHAYHWVASVMRRLHQSGWFAAALDRRYCWRPEFVNHAVNDNAISDAFQEIFGFSIDQQGVFAVLADGRHNGIDLRVTYWLRHCGVRLTRRDPDPHRTGAVAIPRPRCFLRILAGYALTTVVADDTVGLAAEPYALVGDSPFLLMR